MTALYGGTTRANGSGMLFRQLFDPETSTYTYLLADEETREAAIIDPVAEQAQRDLSLLRELGLHLVFTLETHVHADHVTASGALREATGARSAVSKAAGVACADLPHSDGDVLQLGRHKIRVLTTPGHTDGCVSYHVEGRVFTGDALLIRGTGRTDFQSGSAAQLYDSITQKLFALPEETLVHPGHDYKGRTVSSIGEEMRFNPRVAGKTKEEFVRIMHELQLAPPKKIAEAVPANLVCGSEFLRRAGARPAGDVHEVDPVWTRDRAKSSGARIVDVRSPEEFATGHLDDAELVPLDHLAVHARQWDRKTPLVTVCRSGARSARAARTLKELGFHSVASMRGGMLALQEQRS